MPEGGPTKRARVALLALVAVLACAVTVSAVSNAPADPGATVSKKKGKKKRKKGRGDGGGGGGGQSETQRAVFVGNNWDGTADILLFTPPDETPGSSSKGCKGKRGKKRSAQAAKRRRGGCKGKRGRRSGAQAAKKRRGGCKKAGAAKRRKRGKGRRCGKSSPGSRGDGNLRRVARLNIVPDLQQRMLEIATNPVRLVYFLAIRQAVGEGHDQFVDDMYSSNDGRLLIVSRPSLADVVGINIRTGQIVWRFQVAGQRSDHMALSPDGRRVAVSASTGNVVHILDVQTGAQVGQFESGDSPHENTYSRDGSKIFHASIGLVYTPADHPVVDTTKGDRYFQIVDANTNQILQRVDMGQKLAEAGYPNMSSAVRPMAISPDERYVYLQVSFFHGFVEYDLATNRVLRVANLPNEVPNLPRELYLLDSAHHGIAMNSAGTRLCVAGTMSDYAAIVNRDDFGFEELHLGVKPYWSTTSDDGNNCFVSWSGSDRVTAINYRTRREVARIQVGYHPQRVRSGDVRRDWVQEQIGN